MDNRKKFMMGLLVFTLLYSCKKDSRKSEDMGGTPLITERGAVFGDAFEKTIGAAGGTIAFPDGKIKVDIPAGAVDADVNFTIQPVEGKLPTGVQTAYRISPENVQFKKDVSIMVKYSQLDELGSSADELYLAYQDAGRVWHRALNCTLDKINRTLNVKTRHFSDWVIERRLLMVVDRSSLFAGEKAIFKVKYIDTKETEGDGDIMIAPTDEQKSIPLDKVVSWKVIGLGSVPNDKQSTATYTAPAAIPTDQEAFVELTVKNMFNKKYPQRPGTSGLSIIRGSVNLLQGEFIKWKIDGVEYKASLTSATYNAATGTTLITGGGNPTSTISLSFKGKRLIAYNYGPPLTNEKAWGAITLAGIPYPTDNKGCDPLGGVYSDGSLLISQYEDKVGGNIEGIFDGKVYDTYKCSNPPKVFLGSFRVKLKK